MSNKPLLSIALTSRALGYATANFSALLIPLLLYTLTGSLQIAGVSMMIELVPKLALYLYGSSWIGQFGSRKVHRYLEGSRFIAATLLIAAALTWLPWQFVVVAAVLFQAANALSNLLFERNTLTWAQGDKAAYTKLLSMDMVAGVGVAIVGLLVKSPIILASLCASIQLYNVTYIRKHALPLYAHIAPEKKPWSVWLKKDVLMPFNTAKEMTLPLFAIFLISFGMALPIGVLFSQVPFFLDYAFNTKIDAQMISGFNLTRLALGYLALQGMIWLINHYTKSTMQRIYFGLIILFFACVVGLAFAKSFEYVTLLIIAGIAQYSVTPYIRTWRQKELRDVPNPTAMTGLLIAFDATSYLTAASILAAGTSPHQAILCAMAGCFVLSGTGLILAMKAKQQTRPKSQPITE